MKSVYGVWLPATNSQVLYSKQNTVDAVRRIADAGFNTIFPNVWWQGYTLYPSKVMAERFGVAIKSEFEGRDPLAEMVEAARNEGLTIIPWFEYGFIASYKTNGGHILAKYPQWAAQERLKPLRDASLGQTSKGFDWMNGLHPDVQEFCLSLFLEVVEQYDVDGVQADDHLSIPVNSGYDDYTVAEYRREFVSAPPLDAHNQTWMRWRADRLTQFIARIYKAIKAVNPDLIVSMAPSEFPFSYRNFLVDYPDWLRRDIVDWLHPQLYHSGVTGYRASADNAEYHLRAQDLPKVFPGIALEPNGRRFSPSEFWSCITYNRQLGMRGECVWVYEQLRANGDEMFKYFKQRNYGKPFNVLLRRGMRGPDVKGMQSLLEAKGYEVGLQDGIFGALTEAQVRKFQRDRGLASDGIVGPKTYQALMA